MSFILNTVCCVAGRVCDSANAIQCSSGVHQAKVDTRTCLPEVKQGAPHSLDAGFGQSTDH